MEGYTNVDNNPEDFDCLDIEKRIPLRDEDFVNTKLIPAKSEKDRKHSTEEMFQVAPGEPVPPGFEDTMSCVAQIQSTLDSHKTSPLIGLEYLVEISPDEIGMEPRYFCMLCDKKGDPRVSMAHITSINHRVKYIGLYFPSAFKLLNAEYPKNEQKAKILYNKALTHLCSKIEECFGRLKPIVADPDYFEKHKFDLHKLIDQGKHFRESPNVKFVECLSREVIESLPSSDGTPAEASVKPSHEEDKKSTFLKRKITCDRSRLRSHNSDALQGEAVPTTEKKPKEGAKRNSLSPVSSASNSPKSHSRRRRDSRRNRRTRSRSGSRGSRSRSRSRSCDSKGRRWHKRSRSPSYRPFYRRSRSPRRQRRSPRREGSDTRREGSGMRRKRETDPIYEEKCKWNKFRMEIGKLESEMLNQLKFHQKNPENHPQYASEWKKFWNRRYKEIKAENKNPEKHDFKPEWIEFWNDRVKVLYEQEMKSKREELIEKLGLPKEEKVRPRRNSHPAVDDDVIIISSPPSDNHDRLKKDFPRSDSKTASGFSDSGPRQRQQISQELSLNPGRSNLRGNWDDRGYKLGVIEILRDLTAMEDYLGSFGPQINTLLCQALTMERRSFGSADRLMEDSENIILFESVREKLKGQLALGMIPRSAVLAIRRCIENLTELLYNFERSRTYKIPEPVASVPTVGVLDKAAIAQQIAAVLVAQGRANLTQEELQMLVNTVIGTPHTSAEQNTLPEQKMLSEQSPQENTESPLQMLLSTISSRTAKTGEPTVSGLQLLQSAYDEKSGQERNIPISASNPCNNTSENIGELSEAELKLMLQNFKDLTSDEQQQLIALLKTLEEKEPEKIERLRKYVKIMPSDLAPSSSTNWEDSDRMSPFASRLDGINPSKEKPASPVDDSDDDYSFEEIFAAASKKLREQEEARQMKSNTKGEGLGIKSSLQETKEVVANLMNQLSGKHIQKQKTIFANNALGNGSTGQAVPVLDQHSLYGNANNALGNGSTGQAVPVLDQHSLYGNANNTLGNGNMGQTVPVLNKHSQYGNQTSNYYDNQQLTHPQQIPSTYANQYNQESFPQTNTSVYNQHPGYY